MPTVFHALNGQSFVRPPGDHDLHNKYGRFETRASRATKQVDLDMPVMPGRAQDVIFSVNESSIGSFTNIRYAVRPRTGPGHDKPTGRHEWKRLGTPYKDEVGPEWLGCDLAMNTAAPAFVPNPRSRWDSFSEVVLPSLPRPSTPPPFPANRRANGFRRIRKGSFADVDYEKQLPNSSRNASDPWFVKGRKGKVLAPYAFDRYETPRHFDDPIFVRQRRLVDRAVNIPIFLHERFTSGGGCEANYRSTWGSTLKPVSSPTRRPELTAHYEEVSTIGCYVPLSIEVLAICLQPGKVLRRVLTATGQHPTRSMWTWYPNQMHSPVSAPCTLHPLGLPNGTTASRLALAATSCYSYSSAFSHRAQRRPLPYPQGVILRR